MEYMVRYMVVLQPERFLEPRSSRSLLFALRYEAREDREQLPGGGSERFGHLRRPHLRPLSDLLGGTQSPEDLREVGQVMSHLYIGRVFRWV